MSLITMKGTTCDVHENKFYSLYCTDCDYLVCPKCIQRQHYSHKTTDVSDKVLEKKRIELESKVTELKGRQLEELENEVKIVQKSQELYSLEIQNCVTRVKHRGESLKQEIDKLTENYVQEFLQQEKSDLKILKNMENKLSQKLSDLKELVAACEEKLSVEGDMAFIKFVADTLQSTDRLTLKEEMVSLAPPSFHSREITVKDIRKIFGEVRKEFRMNMEDLLWFNGSEKNIKKEHIPQIKVKVISSFENPQSINCLCAINEREAWIGGYNYVTMVTRDGRKHRSIKVDFSVNDIVKCRNGELIIATDSALKKMTTGGDIVKFADMSPFSAQGICLTKDGEIFTCVRSEVEGKVVKVSNRGQITQTIQYAKDGTLLFRRPGFITCTNNDYIWVTEEIDNSVVIVNKNGEIQFKYGGPSEVKLRSPFSPKDITTIWGEQVLINDCRNHSVHLVDKNGKFVQFVMTNDNGLRGPRSICVDPYGYIWVTCWYNNAVVVAKYTT